VAQQAARLLAHSHQRHFTLSLRRGFARFQIHHGAAIAVRTVLLLAQALEGQAALAQQCFRLLTRILRAAVTSAPEVYERESIERYLPGIVEIMEIIATRREKERKNG